MSARASRCPQHLQLLSWFPGQRCALSLRAPTCLGCQVGTQQWEGHAAHSCHSTITELLENKLPVVSAMENMQERSFPQHTLALNLLHSWCRLLLCPTPSGLSTPHHPFVCISMNKEISWLLFQPLIHIAYVMVHSKTPFRTTLVLSRCRRSLVPISVRANTSLFWRILLSIVAQGHPQQQEGFNVITSATKITVTFPDLWKTKII